MSLFGVPVGGRVGSEPVGCLFQGVELIGGFILSTSISLMPGTGLGSGL